LTKEAISIILKEKGENEMNWFNNTIVIKEISNCGYISYIRKDTGEEIARGNNRSVVYIWAKENGFIPKFPGLEATPYPEE
jgi:hypothetical protein